MAVRAACLLPLMAGLLCACASEPPLPTSAEMLNEGKARVIIEDPVKWKLMAPPPLGFRIEITTLNDAGACHGGRCPTEVAAPAGKAKLGYDCILLTGGLRLPRGGGVVEGELAAGHTYGIRPFSVVPDCRVQLVDEAGVQ